MFISRKLRKIFDDINCIQIFYYFNFIMIINDWNVWATIVNCIIILKLSCEGKKLQSIKNNNKNIFEHFLNKRFWMQLKFVYAIY